MRFRYQVVAFDAEDVESESAFWAGVLGGEIDRDGGWHMVPAGHPFCLRFLVGGGRYPNATSRRTTTHAPSSERRWAGEAAHRSDRV